LFAVTRLPTDDDASSLSAVASRAESEGLGVIDGVFSSGLCVDPVVTGLLFVVAVVVAVVVGVVFAVVVVVVVVVEGVVVVVVVVPADSGVVDVVVVVV
jgi:hypothetical protein